MRPEDWMVMLYRVDFLTEMVGLGSGLEHCLGRRYTVKEWLLHMWTT
jgi:hypothetical protein